MSRRQAAPPFLDGAAVRVTPVIGIGISIITDFCAEDLSIAAIGQTHGADILVFLGTVPAVFGGGAIGSTAISIIIVAIVAGFGASLVAVATYADAGLPSVGAGPSRLDGAAG